MSKAGYIVFGILVLSLFSFIPVDSTYAQQESIPRWIKTVFAYYAQDQISETELLNAIQYLVESGIISIPAQDMPGIQEEEVPETQDKEIPDDGDFYITYLPNPNSAYVGDDTAVAWLKNTEILEYQAEFLNENLRLSYDIEIIARECGEINTFYKQISNAGQIVMCYEMIDDLFETWELFNEEAPDTHMLADYVYDTLYYILYHEVAHAIIDVYDIPITGFQEDVADQFAALMILYLYDDETGSHAPGQSTMRNVMTYYTYEDQYWDVIYKKSATSNNGQINVKPYMQNHGTDMQRLENMLCYAYGADPAHNQDLIISDILSEDTTEDCKTGYYQINSSWNKLLEKYSNGFFGHNDDSDLELVKGDNKGAQKTVSLNTSPRFVPGKTSIVYYHIEDLPNVTDKKILTDALEKATKMWASHNSGLRFVESDYDNANIEIKWYLYLSSEAVGLAGCDNFQIISEIGCVLDIAVGDYDCNGNFVQSDEDSVATTIMHEIGHALGLEHIDDVNHLMYGIDPIQEVYDDLGYTIPPALESWFVGQAELDDDIEEMEQILDEINQRLMASDAIYNELSTEYEAYEDRDLTQLEYGRAVVLYEQLEEERIRYNQIADEYDLALDEQTKLIDVYNCYPNIEEEA